MKLFIYLLGILPLCSFHATAKDGIVFYKKSKPETTYLIPANRYVLLKTIDKKEVGGVFYKTEDSLIVIRVLPKTDKKIIWVMGGAEKFAAMHTDTIKVNIASVQKIRISRLYPGYKRINIKNWGYKNVK